MRNSVGNDTTGLIFVAIQNIYLLPILVLWLLLRI